MTENIITYGIMVAIGILAIFSFMIGINKMIRVLLGNYILTSICLAASQSLQLATTRMNNNPTKEILGIESIKLANFIDNGSMTIVMILYITLLVIVFRTSKIKIRLPDDEALKKMLQIIFVPLTIISMILTLQIVLLGMDGITITSVGQIAETVANNQYMFQFVSLTPVRILLHGLLTIFITSEFKVRVETDF